MNVVCGTEYMEVMTGHDGVKAFFSLKDGASDGYPYDRKDVFAKLGLESAIPVWPKQIHEDRIAVIGERPGKPLSIPDTDGLITNVNGVLLTTVHADCLPVYFFDPKKEVIGLVHAGWRGTAAEISRKAVREMVKVFRCAPDDICACIGPGISRCCFETGRDVYNAFADSWDVAGNIDDVTDVRKNAAGEEKYYIDLKEINRRQLEAEGVSTENIGVSSHCTCCEPELFCSYRREGGTYRRMGAGICMLSR